MTREKRCRRENGAAILWKVKKGTEPGHARSTPDKGIQQRDFTVHLVPSARLFEVSASDTITMFPTRVGNVVRVFLLFGVLVEDLRIADDSDSTVESAPNRLSHVDPIDATRAVIELQRSQLGGLQHS